jgi:hypothetical protein
MIVTVSKTQRCLCGSQFGRESSAHQFGFTINAHRCMARFAVQALMGAIAEFQKFVSGSGSVDQFSGTLEALENVKHAIKEEFDVQGQPSKRQRSVEESIERRSFQKRLQYLTTTRDQARRQVAEIRGSKLRAFVQRVWHVRVALSDPGIPPRQLQE